ncbi:MAG: uridylate kinase [Candidatus Magasanikbacteria bacterium]|nr:uridylate kinase [Candidatus Magasanikbacteria bacterium]
MILTETRTGVKFVMIVGGGATCRVYQAAARRLGVKDKDLDRIGIAATNLNAEFVRSFFGAAAYQTVTNEFEKIVSTGKRIIVAKGGKPGASSDLGAVRLAKKYGAAEVINLTNIDGVYDRDPRKNSAAKKISRISWKEYRKMIGHKWTPGLNAPFDPIAAREARAAKIRVVIIDGRNLETVRAALHGKKHSGTIIE